MSKDTKAGQIDLNSIPEYVGATDKQQAFCKYMAAHGVIARAARDAGYSKASASSIGQKLVLKPWVSKAITVLQSDLNAQTGSGPEYVRAQLLENHKLAQSKGNFSGSNRALELLGKANGMFGADRVELTGKDGQPLQTAPMTDIELARYASLAIRTAAESAPIEPETAENSPESPQTAH
jgi:hypothetical protein